MSEMTISGTKPISYSSSGNPYNKKKVKKPEPKPIIKKKSHFEIGHLIDRSV